MTPVLQLFDIALKIYWPAICLFICVSCSSEKPEPGGFIRYFCDAETVEGEGHTAIFENDGNEFHGGQGQTSDEAYSGEYGLRLDTTTKYGFSISLSDIDVGEYFKVSVRVKQKYKHGTLIAVLIGKEKENVLRTYDENFEEDENGWKLHSLSFSIANPVEEVKVYTFSNGHEAYFDDLEIIRYAERPPIEGMEDKMLSIYIPDSANDVLSYYKSSAAKEEVIREEYKEYVEAFILNGTDSLPIEMRLKGDWVDHLVSGKASYRIKTSSKGAFRQLRSFSIQHPQTRNYMHEWFMHRLCDMEDLLSTRYEFLPVEINGVSHGVYALEEHFDKQLLESRNRREGPILKMDESGFWSLIAEADSLKKTKHFPSYASSFISCFKKGRTTKTPALFKQFQLGSNLLSRFKQLDSHPEELFDIQRAAKYYALMDAGNVHHGLAWHNRRFYYNPVTTRLEYIGFDMQPGVLPIAELMPIRQFERVNSEWYGEFLLDKTFLMNDEFREAYTANCKRFSSKAYLDSVFDVLEGEIQTYEEMMGHEIENYRFNREVYYDIADSNRKQLATLDSLWDVFQISNSNGPLNPGKHDFTPHESDFHLSKMALNCYRTKVDSANYLLDIDNFHLNEVEILGYAIKSNKDSVIRLDEEIILPAFADDALTPTVTLQLNRKPSRVYYRAMNNPNLQSRKVLKWPKPSGEHPRLDLRSQFDPRAKWYSISDGTVVLKEGTHTIDRLIYIPDGYAVKILPGTSIDFVNGGGLIVNGDFEAIGTDENKIVCTSSDTSSMGITVFKSKAVVKNAEFRNLGTLDYQGWTLTGAVSFYESEVTIDNVIIEGNTCEDALNTIRCQIEVNGVQISNTWGDGFDADFCTGNFTNSTFRNTGNDCVDFSGSVVTINNIEIYDSGDKGISAGERSTLTVSRITIDGCLTGLASKDQSVLKAKNVTVKNAPIGIACFQKKPEFGPAHIDITDVKYEAVENLGIIELGSSANWDGKDYRGFVKFDIEAMYARFEK